MDEHVRDDGKALSYGSIVSWYRCHAQVEFGTTCIYMYKLYMGMDTGTGTGHLKIVIVCIFSLIEIVVVFAIQIVCLLSFISFSAMCICGIFSSADSYSHCLRFVSFTREYPMKLALKIPKYTQHFAINFG